MSRSLLWAHAYRTRDGSPDPNDGGDGALNPDALGEPVIFHKDGEPRPEPRPRPSSTRFEGGADDEEVTPPPMPGDGDANPTN